MGRFAKEKKLHICRYKLSLAQELRSDMIGLVFFETLKRAYFGLI